jgi:hypothetical protein
MKCLTIIGISYKSVSLASVTKQTFFKVLQGFFFIRKVMKHLTAVALFFICAQPDFLFGTFGFVSNVK